MRTPLLAKDLNDTNMIAFTVTKSNYRKRNIEEANSDNTDRIDIEQQIILKIPKLGDLKSLIELIFSAIANNNIASFRKEIKNFIDVNANGLAASVIDLIKNKAGLSLIHYVASKDYLCVLKELIEVINIEPMTRYVPNKW
ncbi:MAG: hypothetical protein ACRYE9_04490 [Janthinobacterium lividum]